MLMVLAKVQLFLGFDLFLDVNLISNKIKIIASMPKIRVMLAFL